MYNIQNAANDLFFSEKIDNAAASFASAGSDKSQSNNEIKASIDPTAAFKLSYGLFVLTARSESRDNGCIINTAQQVTDKPLQISVTVNKLNYTHDLIMNSGLFNVSILTETAPFEVFKHFGFSSGRDVNKFDGAYAATRSENGILFLSVYTNAFISGRVIKTIDCGTHTLFIAEVTESKILSSDKSATYSYYFEHIKPKPTPVKKKGYVCKICGYVYEGDPLPEDFICPLCKHGAEDFEPLF